MNNKVKYSFPSLTVPESDKDEDWYKQYTQAIVNRSMSEGYTDRVAIANECVNFYQQVQSGEEFAFLQRAEDGDVLPAKWMTVSRIHNKINLLLGELSQKKYDIIVKGLNQELTSRKLKKREEMRIDLRFQPLAQSLEQQSGFQLQNPEMKGANGFQPENEEELDDFFDSGGYKDIAEIVVKAILKYLVRVNRWDYQRIAMFRDILIQGMGFCRTEILDGIPVSQRVDPRNMIWDSNSTDDFLTDSTYFGEIEYMSIGDAIDKYGLTKKEVDEAYNAYTTQYNRQTFSQDANDFNVLGSNSNLRFFKNEGGELRVLVCRACWVDYKPYNNKISKDKFGQVHVKRVSPEASGEDVKRTIIKIWRRATLIGGKFLKQWGEMPNQARDWTHLSNCDAPYKALIPNYMNGIIVSKVHQMKNLQKLKDIALYRMQLDMARSGGRGFMYDVTQLPPGMTLPQAMKYLKTAGILPIDPSASGNPSGFNQFKDIDLTLQQTSINSYLEIVAMLDREMDAISGINEARQGQVKNASQAVGVTQSSLYQSAMSTEIYYDLFGQFCSSVLTYQAKLAKLAWAGKERFAPIIGDSGVDFLAMDVDMDLHDYAVFIEEVPKMIQDEQTFQQIILAALQAGQLQFAQAMRLLLEKDIQAGVRKLERETKKFLEQQAQQEQAMMQQQQEQMMADQQQADQDRQAEQAEGMMTRQNDLKKVVAKGRLDMRGQLIDFKKDVALMKMQKDLEKAKAANRPTAK